MNRKTTMLFAGLLTAIVMILVLTLTTAVIGQAPRASSRESDDARLLSAQPDVAETQDRDAAARLIDHEAALQELVAQREEALAEADATIGGMELIAQRQGAVPRRQVGAGPAPCRALHLLLPVTPEYPQPSRATSAP